MRSGCVRTLDIIRPDHSKQGLFCSRFGELFDREGDRIVAGQYHLDKLQGVCEVATNDGGVLEVLHSKKRV